jgi:hypothetical protein
MAHQQAVTGLPPRPAAVTDGSGVDFPQTSAPGPRPEKLSPRSPPVPRAAREATPAGGEPPPASDWWNDRRKDWPSWLVSLLLHLSLLLLLGSIIFSADRRDGFFGTKLTRGEVGSETGVLDGTEIGPDVQEARAGELRLDSKGSESGAAGDAGQPPIDIPEPRMNISALPAGDEADGDDEMEAVAAAVREGRGKAARGTTKKAGAGKEQEINVEGILGGRGTEARAKLVKSGGGTKESERAVELGLAWLARHQNPDGSWSFQHGPDDPGYLDCPTGATGLALLALLGAGHTHKEGVYRSQVNLGLKYLIDHMEVTSSGGWMLGTGLGTMYVQGICAIALCEACSLSKDPALRRPAQLAIDFIVNAQDPEGGGWRYRIPQPGDTSVVGWQLMALQSARIAELTVPPRVIVRARRFLKSVESEGGARFGYTNSIGWRPSTTAVGLLCRMYLGREQTHKGMAKGMRRLAEWGPNLDDMYYSYYGTLALHHWGDEGWKRWNDVMRDLLVGSQAQEGDAAGSWPPDSSHGVQSGGRLYTTCLCIMTLEVYYRYLPIYHRQGAAEER